MRWWVPVLLTAAVVAATYLLQLLLTGAAAVVEIGLLGKDPQDRTLTPLTYLATNLAIIGIVPVVLLVMSKAAGVSWSDLLTVGRAFSRRRLFGYTGIFALLMVVVNLAVHLVNPSPLSAFAVTGTTVALLAVVLLTTPFQAAAEEIVFRGALTASYGSWFRAARPALVAGIVLSSLLFALLHTSADPWMFVHYLGLAGGTAVMALIGRGLEPAIAFHVVNNVFAMGIGAVFSSGGGIGQDRSAGAGGPYMLLFVLAEVIGVLIVWRMEKRRAERSAPVA
ncbi:CPBP family intramembrane glutamic endopeptidase [Nocardiopsis flavescens]|nr:CPBP family intramembrane glutamic endopeptidase [Nocardiopsis flavescens]